MELLFGMIAELLVVAMMPLFGILGAVFGAIAEAVLTLIGAIFGGAVATRRDSQPQPPVRKKRRRIWRYVLLVPVFVVGIGVFVLNQFFFAPTMRWAVDQVASRTGYVIEPGTIEGDLWTGQLALGDLHIAGQNADGTAADVTVGLLEADLAVLSLLTSNVRLDRLVAADVDVQVKRAAGGAVSTDAAPKQKSGRRFTVEMLDLTNAVMVVQQPDGARHELEIETARVEPLRSNWAPFDLLFRSNLEAQFDGADLRVVTTPIDGNGRRTEWELERMDLTTLAAFTDAAPIRWFEDGTISAQMQDEWRRDDISIDSGWEIRLRDAEIGMGNVRGVAEAVLARALAEVVDAQRGDAEFAFRLQLDEDGFRDSASGDLTAWWDAMIRGLAHAVAAIEPTGTADEAEGRLRGFTQGVRDVLGIERDDN